jgi:hypothetical protein
MVREPRHPEAAMGLFIDHVVLRMPVHGPEHAMMPAATVLGDGLTGVIHAVMLALAQVIGTTKGGMAQWENDQAIDTVRVEAVDKVVQGLGGRLVMVAEFPNGRSRRIRTGRELKETAAV